MHRIALADKVGTIIRAVKINWSLVQVEKLCLTVERVDWENPGDEYVCLDFDLQNDGWNLLHDQLATEQKNDVNAVARRWPAISGVDTGHLEATESSFVYKKL
jgi:hypothetical protein